MIKRVEKLMILFLSVLVCVFTFTCNDIIFALERGIGGESLSDWEYYEKGGDIFLTKYKGTSTDVVIPGELDGKRVVIEKLSSNGLSLPKDVVSVKIGTAGSKVSVKNNDASYAFSKLNNLKHLDMEGVDVSNITNMSYMFWYNENLESIKLNGWNTENAENMCAMFAVCRNLEDIDLSSFNTRNVKDMSYLIAGCNSLKSVNWSDDFTTENVVTMKKMFCECRSLEKLDLSNFDTGKVKTMEDMFRGAYKIESLDLSSFNTENVENMRFMFDCCIKLKKIDVSNFNTGNVKDMYKMFGRCYDLSILDLSSFDTSGMSFDDMKNFLLVDDNITNPNNKIKTPTIVITSDKNIKRYMEEGVGITCRIAPDSILLDANGGVFEDKSSLKKLFDDIGINGRVAENNDILSLTQSDIYKNYTPVKEGYSFTGWYTDEECKAKYESNSDNVDLLSGITLYTGWIKAESDNGDVDTGNSNDSEDKNINSDYDNGKGNVIKTDAKHNIKHDSVTPKTRDEGLMMYTVVLVVSTLGIVFCLRKKFI
ncbi:BspA family leucine-rich repeat surface protein [Anaerofustis sp.]|uniref:BspA family leucine-rich repeat surface protein n=1 Tax=Anaerofustis sp. TaxID=1872517 RepID=UPI0025B7A82B|nr:BspA family leucine-rich repeat surface protein [Anaerofustis sp.]